jgi:hypothetical protein
VFGGPFQGVVVEGADFPAAEGFDAVAEAALGSQVAGAGLARWPGGVVGGDVVEVGAGGGFCGAVGELFDRVGEFDAFADPVGVG